MIDSGPEDCQDERNSDDPIVIDGGPEDCQDERDKNAACSKNATKTQLASGQLPLSSLLRFTNPGATSSGRGKEAQR